MVIEYVNKLIEHPNSQFWSIAVLDRISCVIALVRPSRGSPVMKKLFALIVLFCVGLTHASEPPAKLYAVSDGWDLHLVMVDTL